MLLVPPVLLVRLVASVLHPKPSCYKYLLLGGSWVVISAVISPLIWLISIVTLILTPFITTHEPPSTATTTAKEAALVQAEA